MNELIVCRDCVNSDCTGCNMLVLYHALEQNRFEALMNENRHLNIDTDVVSIQHGRWINFEWKSLNTFSVKCNQCGIIITTSVNYSFCPNCGAKMDGEL